MINFFTNKNYGIIGLGNSGTSTALFLKNAGANVYTYDDGDINNSTLSDENISNMDAIAVSPGIRLRWDRVHKFVALARENFIPIVTDIDIFQRVSVGQNVCVTGTNGKSTTTALLHHIFVANNINSQIGGNFGIPVLSLDPSKDMNVLEISSYQLEGCNTLGFDAAILLNIASDHLVRHGGFHGYISAKQKIFANFKQNSCAVIGVDDPYSQNIYDFLKSIKHPNVIPVSGHMIPNNGIGWHDQKMIDNRNGSYESICEVPELLSGEHNQQNIAATFAVCSHYGINREDFVSALMNFKSLDHRQQFIRSIDGVQYINDSKATNVDSVEHALKRFDNIIWILGGIAKEDGIELLTKYFHKIKYALLIGQIAEKWSQLLTDNGVPNVIAGTLDKAVQQAYVFARKYGGRVVLLSPCCASFDQFASFEDRGDQFAKFVREL